MSRQKLFEDQFTNERRLAWVRFTSQCRFRAEPCELTFKQFCDFWSTPTLWNRRGRNPTDFVLTRFDPKQSWNKQNCCIITRRNQLIIRNLRKINKDVSEYYTEAMTYAG